MTLQRGMSDNVFRFTGPGAEVISLDSHRPTAAIPAEAWNAVESAADAWEQLRSRGREVRFEVKGPDRRLVAELRELDGGVLRALPLREVLGGDGPPPAA